MKSPAFQFYPTDFLADENVVLMTNQEVGCYVKLLCYCWREGSIPADVTKLSKLCGEDGSAMADLWLAIKPCFVPHTTDASRFVHPRLEEERKKQQEHRKERAESGAKGAKARWDKDSKRLTPDGSANGSAKREPMANDGSSSSSSSSASKEDKPAARPRATPPQSWRQALEQFAGRPLSPREISEIAGVQEAHNQDDELVIAVIASVKEKAKERRLDRPMIIIRNDLADLGIAGVRTVAEWDAHKQAKQSGQAPRTSPPHKPSPTAQRQEQGMATLARMRAEALAEQGEAGD